MKPGEWTTGEEKKMVKGHIDIPEFSFGELDDLQVCGTTLSSVREVNDRIIKYGNKILLLRL